LIRDFGVVQRSVLDGHVGYVKLNGSMAPCQVATMPDVATAGRRLIRPPGSQQGAAAHAGQAGSATL